MFGLSLFLYKAFPIITPSTSNLSKDWKSNSEDISPAIVRLILNCFLIFSFDRSIEIIILLFYQIRNIPFLAHPLVILLDKIVSLTIY